MVVCYYHRSPSVIVPYLHFVVFLFPLIYSFGLPCGSAAWGFAHSSTTVPFSSRIYGSAAQDGANSSNNPKRREVMDADDLFENGLLVKPIGIVQSIYRLCVGTPRQGLLAPHARGRLELSLEDDAVLGLDGFSHIWVVFVFHLNTKRLSPDLKRNKVSPPALGGEKIGVLSTRAPHRFNPIGITLCKLEGITWPTKFCKKTFLEVTGLDLVDGTPILDIKPYVAEYDSVPAEELILPSWVSGGLSTRRKVTIISSARDELQTILCDTPKALDFYGTHRGDASWEEAMENVLLTIEEVLSIDVRSSWQTNKVRKGNFRAERADRVQDGITSKPQDEEKTKEQFKSEDQEQRRRSCTQQLDKLLISYTVEKATDHDRTASLGSGAEDEVYVESIQLLEPEKKDNKSAKEDDDGADSIDNFQNKMSEPKESSSEAKEKDTSENNGRDDKDDSSTDIAEEMKQLQYQLALIEALEERNKAQLESFADEQHQWESLEEEDRELLLSKDSIVERLERIPEPKERETSENNGRDDKDDSSNDIAEEMEKLQYQLTLIEALEERNKAQLESFADEQHQWESLEEEDRELLLSKDSIVERLEQITSELVQMWMGGKSMEG